MSDLKKMHAEYRNAVNAGQAGDYKTALRILRSLSKRGHADAQFNLGNAYYLGKGTEKNDKKAEKYFLAAAVQGHVAAQRDLGVLFTNRTDIPPNNVIAYMWFGIAERNGDKIAINPKSLVSAMMMSEEIAEAEKMIEEWFKKHPNLTATIH